MLRQMCTAMNGRKLLLAAVLACITFMPGITGDVLAIENEFKEVLEESGKYSCLSAEEVELLGLVNTYRGSHGLPAVTNSRSLTKVARMHVLDLFINRPAEGKDIHGDDCNLHSWSNKGFWTPACNTRTAHNPESIWYKAKEITNYVYTGSVYENAYWASIENGIPFLAMKAWKKSPKHNALMLETGEWKGENFQAIGVAIYKGFAVIWVGQAKDKREQMAACDIQVKN